jgi:putative two-component system response regulator
MMAVGEESVRPVVIVVDDDDDTCAILSGFLQNEFRVLTARSAEQCLQILKRETADLVLLDLLMSEMDGLATLREIKRNPAIANTSVIVVTAWDDVSALAEAKRLGVKECLIKPVFRRRLLRSVRTHLTSHFGPT